MGYSDQWQKAVNDNLTTEITSTIHQWDQEGQTVIGKVVELGEFDGGKFDGSCVQYRIDTDDGIITTLLGSATDKQVSEYELVGKIVKIVFNGKKLLDDGRQVNLFDVTVITDAS